MTPVPESSRAVEPFQPLALPPHAAALMRLFQEAGAAKAVLYGGALRDADCSAAYDAAIPVSDYDVRITLLAEDFPAAVAAFTRHLERRLGVRAEDLPVFGPGKLRRGLSVPALSLDLSFRPIVQTAERMAARSDLGLSAIAMDETLRVVASRAYRLDREERTLSVHPSLYPERCLAYARRLQAQKFPEHSIVDAVTRAPLAEPVTSAGPVLGR